MVSDEYAPEYSHAERAHIVALGTLASVVLIGVCQFWLFPWLHEFSESAHCRTVFGVSGTAVLFYGIFIGIPLHAALLVILLVGRRGFKVVREGRIPPAGEKVFRPTRIIRGVRAKLLGYVQLFAAVPLLCIVAWGAFQAESSVKQAYERPSRCAPNPSIERAPSSWLRQPPATAHVER